MKTAFEYFSLIKNYLDGSFLDNKIKLDNFNQ
jgi:hypothetical protein